MAPQPSTWRGSSEQISLAQVGCEARKIPAEGEVFFLDFYLYRTIRIGLTRRVCTSRRNRTMASCSVFPGARRAKRTHRLIGGPARQIGFRSCTLRLLLR